MPTTDADQKTRKPTREQDLPPEPLCPGCGVRPNALTGQCRCNDR